jgi:hypothetical protein
VRRISAARRLTRHTPPLTLRRPRARALPSHEAACQAAMAKGRSRSRCRATQSSVRPQADECYALFSRRTHPNLVRSGSQSAWRRSAARPQQTLRSSLWLPLCATYGRGNGFRPPRHAEPSCCNRVFCSVKCAGAFAGRRPPCATRGFNTRRLRRYTAASENADFFRSFQGPLGQTQPTTAPKSKRRGPAWAPRACVAPRAVCGRATGDGAATGGRRTRAARIRTKSACAATRLTCRLNENYSFLEDQHDHGSATRNGKAKAIGRSPPRFM